MRILVINPNISEGMTGLIHAEARRSVLFGTTLTMATAPSGMTYIGTRFEALVGDYTAVYVVAGRTDQFGDVMVVAFGNPSLTGIKKLCSVPVVGMTEAALVGAYLLGQCFSITAISSRIQAWYHKCVIANGLPLWLASMHSLQQPLRDIGSVQKNHAARSEELNV